MCYTLWLASKNHRKLRCPQFSLHRLLDVVGFFWKVWNIFTFFCKFVSDIFFLMRIFSTNTRQLGRRTDGQMNGRTHLTLVKNFDASDKAPATLKIYIIIQVWGARQHFVIFESNSLYFAPRRNVLSFFHICSNKVLCYLIAFK